MHDPLHTKQNQAQIYHFNQRDPEGIFPRIAKILLNSNLSCRYTDYPNRQLSQKTQHQTQKQSEKNLHVPLVIVAATGL